MLDKSVSTANAPNPILLPGAHGRIAMISVHTSPLARPGSYAAGGMNVYVRETAQQLARRGYAVDVFTRNDGRQSEVVSLGGAARLISIEAGPRHPVAKEAVPDYLPEFLHAMRSFRQRHDLHYDLLHSHYWHGGWVARLLGPRWGVPHVTMFHTLGEVKNRASRGAHEPNRRIDNERLIARAADRIICAAEHEKNLLVSLYAVDPERIAIIPCGVDMRRFRPLDRAACRNVLGISGGPIVLYAGRVEPLKGIDILIDAMALLKRRDAQVLIVGDDGQAGGELKRLQARAIEVGVADRVRFVGAVNQSELPTYYNAADVCVVPSHYESFGLVAVEAMACGVPVVAARVGGLATTVRDGETGYLIPWRAPELFAERIDWLLQDDDLRAKLGKAARASVRHFSWPRVASELSAEYTRLWQEQGGGEDCHGRREFLHTVCAAR
ncbi:MAG: glycosyltransferase [Dehalococcoidia bacterium]